jgi:hypothetical protein
MTLLSCSASVPVKFFRKASMFIMRICSVLPAGEVIGTNYHIIHEFCRELSLCSRGHTVLRDGVTYTVLCFSDRSHADLFRVRFGGERFDPKDRGRGREWSVWRKG